jgi:predicted nicotinamide N-methyase
MADVAAERLFQGKEEEEAAEDAPSWRGKWFALLHAKLGVQSTDITTGVRAYSVGNCTVQLSEDAEDTADGQVVYDAGLLLAGYLATVDVSLGACMELGTGVGIVGLFALAAGRATTCALTDGVEGCLTLARENVEKLGVGERATVAALRWGELFTPRHSCDTVLVGDCLFYREWEPLLETVLSALKPNGKVLICHRIRSSDEMGFFELAAERGLTRRRILFPASCYEWTIDGAPIEDVRAITHRCELYELTFAARESTDTRAADAWAALD